MKTKIREFAGDYSMAGTLRMTAPGNLRMDQTVRGYRGNILSNGESQLDPQPKAAVVLVIGRDGKFLGIADGEDPSNINMPGGGIEKGETPEEAAKRELWEETGLIATIMPEIYRENDVVVFRAVDPHGTIRDSDEGVTRWVSAAELSAGRHGEFFQKMLKKIFL